MYIELNSMTLQFKESNRGRSPTDVCYIGFQDVRSRNSRLTGNTSNLRLRNSGANRLYSHNVPSRKARAHKRYGPRLLARNFPVLRKSLAEPDRQERK